MGRHRMRKSAKRTRGAVIERIGDYDVLCEIARGGMGAVFKAKHRKLDRVVALKMMLAGPFATDEEKNRFRVEAEAAAQLDHPNIVPVFNVGEHNHLPYFSMGYVEGESLAAKIQNEPLSIEIAASIAQQLAEAMAYAHAKGVLHRDIKPLNVLVDKQGAPRLTDFGLARRTDSNNDLTGTGQVLGTPSYMSPEQALGMVSRIDARSDVYSIGATLYCMLLGHPPFQAASSVDTLRLVIERDPPSLRAANPNIPKDLATICLKCLRKEPHARYASAEELADDLRRFRRGEPIVARPVGRLERLAKWARRHPAVSALSAACVVALCCLIIGSAWYRRQLADAETRTDSEREGKVQEQYRSLISEITLLNESRQTGFGQDVWERIAEAQRIDSPVVDRDQLRQLAVNSLGDPAFEHPRVLEFDSDVYVADVTLDDRFLFVGLGNKEIAVVDLKTGQETQRLTGHTEIVIGIRMLSETRVVTSAAFCKEALVWDRKPNGEWDLAGRLDLKKNWEIYDIRLSPDAKYVLSLGPVVADSNTATIVAWSERTTELRLKVPDTEVVDFVIRPTSLPGASMEEALPPAAVRIGPAANRESLDHCYDNNDRYLVSGFIGAEFATVYDLHDVGKSHKIQHRCGTLSRIAISSDSRYVALSGHRGFAVHEISGEEVAFPDELGMCSVIQFVGAKNDLLAQGSDGARFLYSVSENRVLHRYPNSVGKVLRFATNGRHWLRQDEDNALAIASLIRPERTELVADRAAVHSVQFSPDGRHLFTGGEKERIRCWELSHRTARNRTLPGEVIAIHPNGRLLACVGWEGLFLWDLAAGRLAAKIDGQRIYRKLEFSPDGRYLAGGGWNVGEGQVWELVPAAAEPATKDWTLKPIDALDRIGGTFVWTPNAGHDLTYRDDQGRFQVVSASDPAKTKTISDEALGKRTQAIAFLDEHRLLSTERSAKVVDINRDAVVESIDEELRSPFSLSPDGRFLVARDALLDTQTWRKICELPIPDTTVWSICWSPDGRQVAYGMDEGRVIIWNVEEVLAMLRKVELGWKGQSFGDSPKTDGGRANGESLAAAFERLPSLDQPTAPAEPVKPTPTDMLDPRLFDAKLAFDELEPVFHEATQELNSTTDRAAAVKRLLTVCQRKKWSATETEQLLVRLRDAAEQFDEETPAFRSELSSIHHALADHYNFTVEDRLDDAVLAYRREWELLKELPVDETTPVSRFFWCQQNLSVALKRADQIDEALAPREAAMQLQTEHPESTAPNTNMEWAHRELVDWLAQRRRYEEAEAAYERYRTAYADELKERAGVKTQPKELMRWLYSFGGFASIQTGGGPLETRRTLEELPDSPYAVQQLHFYEVKTGDFPHASQFHRLSAGVDVTYVNLSRHPARGAELKDLLRHLAAMPNLHTLALNGVAVDPHSLKCIAPIPTLRQLLILDTPAANDPAIRETRSINDKLAILTTNGQYAAVLMLADDAEIKARTAAGQSITIRNLQQLAADDVELVSVRPSPSLPMNGHAISALLPATPSLERLDLSERKDIDDAFVLKTLTKYKTLRQLDLTGVALSPQSIAALRTALPNCEVVVDR